MDNVNGFKAEFGPRNYRPELPANHPREHLAVWFDEPGIQKACRILPGFKAQHRLAFMTAAFTVAAYFLDMYQTVRELPFPDKGEKFCGILNDDEPSRGGARGPTFFHATSLIRLVESCDSITVNAAGVVPFVYLQSSGATAYHRLNSLLIETQPEQARAWMEFCSRHNTKARATVVFGKDVDFAHYSLLAQPGTIQ